MVIHTNVMLNVKNIDTTVHFSFSITTISLCAIYLTITQNNFLYNLYEQSYKDSGPQRYPAVTVKIICMNKNKDFLFDYVSIQRNCTHKEM